MTAGWGPVEVEEAIDFVDTAVTADVEDVDAEDDM
jgi:hypothetical protein